MTLEQSWHRVPGGTAIAALGMARALSRRELEVVGVAAFHRRPPDSAWCPPVPTRQLPLPRFALYESWHALRLPRIDVATGPVDVIHATTIIIPPKSAPLVVTIHDLAWVRYPGHFTKRGRRFFDRGLGLALREADLVLCPSRATLQDCRSAGFGPERLEVVPFGINAQPVDDEDVRRIRRRYSLDHPYVLWIGTVEPRKNLRAVLQAFQSIDNGVDLVLAGPRGWNEDLDAMVGRRSARVRPLGFVTRADLAPLYAGARVFCWPSLLEGFGFPVLEAMSQGTPVVTSAGTSTEELARDAGVLVDPSDVAAITTAVNHLLSDAALARRLGEAGRRRAKEYTWERTGTLVAAAYARVAA